MFLSKITETKTAGDSVSPLLIYWAYQAASTYASLYLESGDGEHLQSWAIVDKCLKVLAKRWGIAGKFLQACVNSILTMIRSLPSIIGN